jgi:hypothetical protein
MAEEKISDGEGTVEATGDAIVIAESIYAGLSEIAQAIRDVNKTLKAQDAEDYGSPQEVETYMDGTPVR